MALASLCQNLKYAYLKSRFEEFQFGAFIVDHKARDVSNIEAVRTQERLKELGPSFLCV